MDNQQKTTMSFIPEHLKSHTEQLSSQFQRFIEPFTGSFLDNSEKGRRHSSWKKIRNAIFLTLIGSFPVAEVRSVSAASLPKREAVPHILDGKHILQQNEARSLIQPFESDTTLDSHPANFNVISVPSLTLRINPDANGHFFDALPGISGLRPEFIQSYGDSYKFVFESKQQVDSAADAYGGSVGQGMKDAWRYAAEFNARQGENAIGLAMILDGQHEYLVYQAITDFQMTTQSNGEETQTPVRKGSIIVKDGENQPMLIPISDSANTYGLAPAKDILQSLIKSGQITEGDQTLQLNDAFSVDLRRLRDENPSMFIEISDAAPKRPIGIVAVQAYGEPTNQEGEIAPTLVPTAAPTPDSFSKVILIEALGDVVIPGETSPQIPLDNTELTELGENLDSGVKTTVTDGTHTQDFIVTVSGMPSEKLVFNRSILEALNIAGYSLDSARSAEEVRVVVVERGVLENVAEEMGLTVKNGESISMSGGLPSVIFAFSETQIDGRNVDAVLVTQGFLDKFYKGNTDQNGDVIPFEKRFSDFVGSSFITAITLRAEGLQTRSGEKPMLEMLSDKNGYNDFSIMSVDLPVEAEATQ